jgi:hypothetical protein
MTVELCCVREGSRLRMHIACYIAASGQRFDGVYDNTFNCRFPRGLRVEGGVYHVPDGNVRLVCGPLKVPYYSVKTADISIVSPPPAPLASPSSLARTFVVSKECVVCMEVNAAKVFVPCGHLCTCAPCAARLSICCICRAPIQYSITTQGHPCSPPPPRTTTPVEQAALSLPS